MTGIRPYDRRSGFLYTDDIVKIVDFEGHEGIFTISRHESIAQHTVQFTQRIANGGLGPGQEVFAEFRFTQPARENRIFEFRPFIFAVRQLDIEQVVQDGQLILPPTPLNMVPIPAAIVDYVDDRIPKGVELRWRHPTGSARLGTDLQFPVNVVNPTGVVVTPAVGGANGGFIEAILTPYVDDFSDLWRLYAIYGHTIEFGIANRTNFFWAPGAMVGGDGDSRQYFIGLVGRKYLLGAASEEIVRRVQSEDIDYKTITVGGVPIVTTRA